MNDRASDSPKGFKLRLKKPIFGQKVRLREKKLSDARNDYAWQSDPELSRLDAAPKIDVAFPFYLLDYAEILHSSRKSNRLPFAVETFEGKHIGNCSCYDIDEDEGEAQLGIMIGDREYWGRGYGADAVNTLVDHIFLNTGIGRIYLKTLDWNQRAQQCFKKCGFIPCGKLSRNGHHFIIMELKREQWRER